MARKKYFMQLETKEDFDRIYEAISNASYKRGFRDGQLHAMSKIIVNVDDICDEMIHKLSTSNGEEDYYEYENNLMDLEYSKKVYRRNK